MTAAPSALVQIAKDQVAGNEAPFDCRHVAGDLADEVSRFVIRIPAEVPFTRIEVEENDQAATTIDAFFTSLDQV